MGKVGLFIYDVMNGKGEVNYSFFYFMLSPLFSDSVFCIIK